ncbi:Phenylacetate-coenzyme A ligase [Planctomycetes bacterium CA13]|uniref:Phenylacetate-coenzyme A ligase n=1 Tax=Novipirellula herctigrandis TaxID=2527986 RepID=A0A5C5YZB9_9BACT|nr:Phenylacetate-coenzyme A ligase [Planctomycetes bacterium CA13]
MRFSLLRILGYCVGGLWTAWGGRKRINARQLRRLRRLVEKVRQDSPLFQKLYSDLRASSLIELHELPVTRKPDLMREFDDWLTIRYLPLTRARDHLLDIKQLGVPIGDVAVFRTSGTSGEPAVIVLPSAVFELLYGITLARLDRSQFRIIKEARKAGLDVAISGGNGHFAGAGIIRLMNHLRPWLAKRTTFIEAEQPIEKIVEQLNAIDRIGTIVTYPSVLSILAREKEAGRLNTEPALFRVGGETLTDDLCQKVRHAFPSSKHHVVNSYASTECFTPSLECSHRRLHVHEDWVILEAVDENMRPVPDGTLSTTALLTVLVNDVQPIIRYDMGDRLRFYSDPCRCGSPFRSFQVVGRQATLLHIGEVVLSPLVFDLEHEQARRIQLVQSAEKEFEVRIELAEDAVSEAVFEQVIQSVKRVFQENNLPDVEVRASQSSPQLTASGKFHEVLPLT